MSKLRELERRLEAEPDNLGLRVTLAGALREAGRQADAVELYRSVAIRYRDQGRSQQAIAVCRSILEIAPGDGGCQALLAALAPAEVVIEAGTPPPPEPRLRTRPPTGTPVSEVRLPKPVLGPRPTAPPRPVLGPGAVPFPRAAPLDAPVRRSSFDETPLPRPVPHHVADPTARLRKLSDVDLPVAEDARTRPGTEDGALPDVEGIANAARRISVSLGASEVRGDAGPQDLAAELDTRRRRRLEAGELAKISAPPPTAPVERYELIDVDEDAQTPPPDATVQLRAASRAISRGTPEEDTGPDAPDEPDEPDEPDDEDDGIPTLSDEDEEEWTNPRELPIETMLRTEQQGPLAGAFFAPLPADRRGAVYMRFQATRVAPGTTVIRQGEAGHALVVVVRGQLEVRVERPGGPAVHLAAITVGEFVGEAALLARTPAPTQVIAMTECELLLLAPRDFYELAGAFPALWAALKDVAERRTRELEARLKR